MEFEKGTEIFNMRGDRRIVATDRRDHKGYLWVEASYGRTKVYSGEWFSFNDIANIDIYTFVKASLASQKPLRDAAKALGVRSGKLARFAEMVGQVVNGGHVYAYSLAEFLGDGSDSKYEDDAKRVSDRLGNPTIVGALDVYEASIEALPVPVITVRGANGSVLFVSPPGDFKLEHEDETA